MATPQLTTCLCGNSQLDLGPSQHREQARAETDAHLHEVLDIKADLALNFSEPSQATRLNSTIARGGEKGRDAARTHLATQILSRDAYEVSCSECGRWAHGNTEPEAAATWNKAIAKLDHLQECCKADYERRRDYDGQVMHVCTSAQHDDSIHGRRYLPLEPGPMFDIKPSDAETKA